MSRRYGKKRVPGCQCESNYTCGPCLQAAPPWHNTPSTVPEQVQLSVVVRGHGPDCRCNLCRMIPFVPNEQEY